MRSKFKWIFTLIVALTMQLSFSQEKTVTGTVSDASGTLPGANVVVKGTKLGVETDVDGKYSIKAKQGDVLVVSFVGMQDKFVTVSAASSYNVKMSVGQELDQVVVTGFNIKRAPKSLTYSTKKIDSEELTQAAPINAVTALAGKVSGLNIITKNNGVNPTTSIILRGYRSITGNNQALIVIDGVVQANTALDNLNPNDITSVNILKGSSAGVLYGSQGANGALIVTTKQGSKNSAMQVDFNYSSDIEKIKYFPQLQTSFGPGNNEQYDPFENTNWGPRFDGIPRRLGPILADGSYQLVPYSAVKDGRKGFFVDGQTSNYGVSLSGGDANSNYFFSANTTDVKGIVPNDQYKKNNFRFNASRTSGKLKMTTNTSFSNSDQNVAGAGGYQGRPIMWNILNTVANVRLTDYKDWRNNKFATPEGYYNEYYQNPYMLIDIARDKTKENRLFANVKAEFQFSKSLSASYSLTGTYFNRNILVTRDAVTVNPSLAPTRVGQNTPASVVDSHSDDIRVNSDFLLKYDTKLSEDFKFLAILGNAVSTYSETNIALGGNNLTVPYVYNSGVRTGELTGSTFKIKERTSGYFADLTLGYKDFLSLNGAYRYDKSSTLPLKANGFSYYSFGTSLSVLDLFKGLKSDYFSYWKLNGSYAKVGNAPSNIRGSQTRDFSTANYATPLGFPYGSTIGFSVPLSGVSLSLTPEFTNTFEVGTELTFFSNRLNIGASYFNSNTTNQFLFAGASNASGNVNNRVNSGEIRTKGFELDINGSILRSKNKDFEWKVGFNLGKINNKVISLSDGSDKIQTGLASAEVGIYAAVGSSYPSVFGTAYTRDDQGRVVIDAATGNPVTSPVLKNLGSTTPNLVLGLNSSVRYKHLVLSAVSDYKTGHVYYNNLVDALEFTGSTQHSVTSGRQPFIFPNSSYADPLNPGSYIANNNIATASGSFAFWNGVYNTIKENYIVDATTFKLREVALSYDLDPKFFAKTFVKSASIGFVARNVLMLRSAQNKYTDPEFTVDGQQVTGFGTQDQLPPTGSYGFKLDVKF